MISYYSVKRKQLKWWKKLLFHMFVMAVVNAYILYLETRNENQKYEGCPKSKCTDFLFKCLLDSPEITTYLLQSMTLGKLHSCSNVFSTDHNSTRSHFL